MTKYWVKNYFAHGSFPEVKSRKNVRKITFFFCIYLLVMTKYWVKNYFAHGRFPEVGKKQKTEERRRERKRERLNNGDNNGQATHGARKHAWRTQAAWAKMLQMTLYNATNM